MKTAYDIFHKLFSAYFHNFSKIAYERSLYENMEVALIIN